MRAGDQSRKRANGGDDRAAIHAIRQPADGVLGHGGGENADRHEGGNLVVVRPLSRAYTGPIEKMVAEIRPDTVTPTTPRGELRYRSRQADFSRHRTLRQLLCGNHDGNHRQGDQHRDQHERTGGERVRNDQQELRGAETQVQDEHVDRQQSAAVRAACAIVEPAFRDDVDAREAYAGDQTHRGPHQRVDEAALDQNRHRGDGGEGGEYADVADLPHQRQRDHGSEDIPHVVAGHDGAGEQRRESFESGAEAEKGALQTGAQHEHPHAEQQGPG